MIKYKCLPLSAEQFDCTILVDGTHLYLCSLVMFYGLSSSALSPAIILEPGQALVFLAVAANLYHISFIFGLDMCV